MSFCLPLQIDDDEKNVVLDAKGSAVAACIDEDAANNFVRLANVGSAQSAEVVVALCDLIDATIQNQVFTNSNYGSDEIAAIKDRLSVAIASLVPPLATCPE